MTSLENSLTISYKVKVYIYPAMLYQGIYPEKCSNKNLYINVYCGFIYNSQNLETSTFSEWVNKLWHIPLKQGIISHPPDKARIKEFNNTKCWHNCE